MSEKIEVTTKDLDHALRAAKLRVLQRLVDPTSASNVRDLAEAYSLLESASPETGESGYALSN